MNRAAIFALLLAGAGLAQVPPGLESKFQQPELNYLILDAQSRQVLAARWPGMDQPIPVGSLVKPFTSLAFSGPFPEFECHGKGNSCWRSKPHGRLNFTGALAQSCNAYFLQLASRVSQHNIDVVASRFGIPPPRTYTPQDLIGLGDNWRVAPLQLAGAYIELAARRGEPGVNQILAGLESAALNGTAQQLSLGLGRNGPQRVLGKTGTAPCADERPHAGDGFAMALYPAGAPRFALLVRVHNVPGAEAAKTAARILRYLRDGR